MTLLVRIWFIRVFPFSSSGIDKVAMVTSLRFQILLDVQAPARHQSIFLVPKWLCWAASFNCSQYLRCIALVACKAIHPKLLKKMLLPWHTQLNVWALAYLKLRFTHHYSMQLFSADTWMSFFKCLQNLGYITLIACRIMKAWIAI